MSRKLTIFKILMQRMENYLNRFPQVPQMTQVFLWQWNRVQFSEPILGGSQSSTTQAVG